MKPGIILVSAVVLLCYVVAEEKIDEETMRKNILRGEALEEFYTIMQTKKLQCEPLKDFIRDFVENSEDKKDKTEKYIEEEEKFKDAWNTLYYTTCHPVPKLSETELYERAMLVISGDDDGTNGEETGGCPMGYGRGKKEKQEASGTEEKKENGDGENGEPGKGEL